MYIEEEYPMKDGEVRHVMSYTTNDLNLVCEKRSSMPVFIVKCGDKYYHKVDQVTAAKSIFKFIFRNFAPVSYLQNLLRPTIIISYLNL